MVPAPVTEVLTGGAENDSNIAINLDQQQKKVSEDESRYSFSQSWFSQIRSEWEQRTSHLGGRKLRILELGSFEGASTTWLLDNLMDHPQSSLTAIDTFEGGMEHQIDSTGVDQYQLSSSPLEQRFNSNVSKSSNYSKLHVLKTTTYAGLLNLRHQNQMFDFIYIDASHVAIDVLHDAMMCWLMLTVGGTMVFDDFSWKGYLEDCLNPRIAIEGFLACAGPEVESEETESQLWLKRVPRRGSSTPNPDPDLYYWDRGLAKKESSS